MGCIEISGSPEGMRWLHWEASTETIQFTEVWVNGDLIDNAAVFRFSGRITAEISMATSKISSRHVYFVI